MGKVVKVVKRVALATGTFGFSEVLRAGKKAFDPDMPHVASAEQLEDQARKKADKRRRLRSAAMREYGKTIFTSPRGVAGLKTKVGQ
jgi:hypothetical protein